MATSGAVAEEVRWAAAFARGSRIHRVLLPACFPPRPQANATLKELNIKDTGLELELEEDIGYMKFRDDLTLKI